MSGETNVVSFRENKGGVEVTRMAVSDRWLKNLILIYLTWVL
jgi:hypothetical protein